MLKNVFYTSVLVSDQDRALDFYTNVLGLEHRVENPTPDGPRFLTVGVEGDEFQLVLWPGTPGQAQPVMGRPPASVTIETDDVRKTVEDFKSRGVNFVSDVLEFPWGSVAQFQDPDGNLLQIRAGPLRIRRRAAWRRSVRRSRPPTRRHRWLRHPGRHTSPSPRRRLRCPRAAG